MSRLKDDGVVLEVCPSSNICLMVFPDLASHSLPLLVDEGVKVTINSDDPAMFGTTLTDEYTIISEAFGYGAGEFRRFNETALEASLCSEERRKEIRVQFESEWIKFTC